MFPIIFKYKIITIGGYGVILGIGFFISFLLLEREFKLRNINPGLAYTILLTAIPSGLAGARIFSILESSENFNQFLANPISIIYIRDGLSAYGGYILAFIICAIIIKRKKMGILSILDAASPSLALGYCFGRFGCHVAGDGCFGIKTTSFWGTPYPNGIIPSSIPVYPTPLFEVLISFIAAGVLLNMRKLELKEGRLFSTFLILSGLPRFFVEFIRRNPELISGISQAQVISIFFVAAGIIGWIYTLKKRLPFKSTEENT